MSTVGEIERAIKKLSPKQFAKLREWIAALDAERWDAQFEADVAAGKLDAFGTKAVKEFQDGHCTDL